MAKISVIINTLNEEKRLPRALSSLKGFANEIIVVDMHSTDETRTVAKKFGAKVFQHKKVGYVEPARNFGIEKAKYDWVFVLDADEWMPKELKTLLKDEAKKTNVSYFRIPRKNMIFGKWIKHSGWWPDYNIRFFRKGTVSWNEIIHSVPTTTGIGYDLPAEKDNAIVHRNYSSVEEYISRMNKYTSVQAKNLNKEGYKFSWRDLIIKPTSEFLKRFFVNEGYKDGVHGLALSLLQAFSELVLYCKLWQKSKFVKRNFTLEEVLEEFTVSAKQFTWWLFESKIKKSKTIKKIWYKLIRKIKHQFLQSS